MSVYQKIEDANAEITLLEQEKRALEDKVEALEKTVDSLTDEVDTLTRKHRNLIDALDTIKSEAQDAVMDNE